MLKNALYLYLAFQQLVTVMAKKKTNYEIVADEEIKFVIDCTKKDDVALGITLDVINDNGNWSGITLYSLKGGRRQIVARFKGTD